MGVWGTGLYSGDFAMDLRATIGAVSRLPFSADRLVEILCETEPTAANNPNDEEHTTFWLILADQFAKRGISCDPVRERAIEIIDRFEDLAMLEKLGATPADIRRRRKLLLELLARIKAPPVNKPRAILNKPQKLLMEAGDIVVYPTCVGKCINPYFASKELDKRYTKDGPLPWKQDGWAAAVILDCGRAFEFLSWYRPLTLAQATKEKPTLESLRGDLIWRLKLPGTCSLTHFKRMELERIESVPLDLDKLEKSFGRLSPGISAAVSDISIANRLNVIPHTVAVADPNLGEASKHRAHMFRDIERILKD